MRLRMNRIAWLDRRRAVAAEAAEAAEALPRVGAHVFLETWPEEAFGVFVEEIGLGLRTSLIRPESGLHLRFGRDAGGRFVEVHDAVADDSFELGRVTIWAPSGGRLASTWREPDWPHGASTDLDVRFEPIFGGTLVHVDHSGFERLGPTFTRAGAEYRAAWAAGLGWVAGRARARARRVNA
jgi:hypothetical protein